MHPSSFRRQTLPPSHLHPLRARQGETSTLEFPQSAATQATQPLSRAAPPHRPKSVRGAHLREISPPRHSPSRRSVMLLQFFVFFSRSKHFWASALAQRDSALRRPAAPHPAALPPSVRVSSSAPRTHSTTINHRPALARTRSRCREGRCSRLRPTAAAPAALSPERSASPPTAHPAPRCRAAPPRPDHRNTRPAPPLHQRTGRGRCAPPPSAVLKSPCCAGRPTLRRHSARLFALPCPATESRCTAPVSSSEVAGHDADDSAVRRHHHLLPSARASIG